MEEISYSGAGVLFADEANIPKNQSNSRTLIMATEVLFHQIRFPESTSYDAVGQRGSAALRLGVSLYGGRPKGHAPYRCWSALSRPALFGNRSLQFEMRINRR